MRLKGVARVDRRTKSLVGRLRPHEIAIIDHEDMDWLAAESLLRARVAAVVNARLAITGRYPNEGPRLLTEAGVPVIDGVGDRVLEDIREGERIEIQGAAVLKAGRVVASGRRLTRGEIVQAMERTRRNLATELDSFVTNTVEHVGREKAIILGRLDIPRLRTRIARRHVLVVARGRGYREDLAAIRSYIVEEKPVLIGVDGGADALRELGYRPDLIVGDMDSVSDFTLTCGAEIVVHAYANGAAPGMERLQRLGCSGHVFAAPGTSEDIAMLLAYEAGAELIVAVGTHSNLIDFLEKGRKGMASTFLARLKVGRILVDAKGVSKLHRSRLRPLYLFELMLGALVPLVTLLNVSPPTRYLLRLLLVRLKLMLGIWSASGGWSLM